MANKLKNSNLASKIAIIDNKLFELNCITSLNFEEIKRLRDWYRGYEVYSSNALEGNTITFAETHLILNDGITVDGKPFKEHLEIVNLAAAIRYIEASLNEVLSEDIIKRINYIVTYSSLVQGNYGNYKTKRNWIGSSDIQTAPPNQVTKVMKQLIEWYLVNKDVKHPIEVAGFISYMLTKIHPFDDGNGRVSRLLYNFILLKANYLPICLDPHKDRSDYTKAIRVSDGETYPNTYIAFMANKEYEMILSYIERIN
ncbi:MAG TPA: Fic family protein [Clostridium sp.]